MFRGTVVPEFQPRRVGGVFIYSGLNCSTRFYGMFSFVLGRYETAQSKRTDARGIHLTAWKQTAWAEAFFSFFFLPNRTV